MIRIFINLLFNSNNHTNYFQFYSKIPVVQISQVPEDWINKYYHTLNYSPYFVQVRRMNKTEKASNNSKPPHEHISQVLEDKGYRTAGYCWERVEEPHYTKVGILMPRGVDRLERFGWLRKVLNPRQRDELMGVVYLDNEMRKAVPEEKWIIEAYGEENRKRLEEELLEEFKDPYDVDIEMRTNEGPEFEYLFV